MYKKITALLLALILSVVVFSGCSDDKTPNNKTPYDKTSNVSDSGNTWTVMLYLCGTDLESDGGAATANLEEILSADLSENINFLIQTGGTSVWHTDGIDSSKIQRFKVENNTLSVIDEQESASMGSADTLGDYLKWGTENYPADKYMVTFWNHGGGSVSGVAFDELYDNDSLTLSELSEGISQADVEFEVIGFDTCLMATLENADTISPYGKYMVASEEYEPGGGWSYDTWLNFLSENPDCNGEELGKSICDSYYEKCELYGNEAMATLSVTDLSSVGELSKAFEEMASEMSGVTEDVTAFKSLAKGAVRAENYGGNTDDEGYTNMVDLGDLVSKTKNVLTETTDNVMSALDKAVLYQVKGENRANANGLSVFFPLCVDSDICDSYAEITSNTAYLKFIDIMSESWTAPDWVYEEEERFDSAVTSDSYDVKLSTRLDDDNYFEMKIDSGLEIIESVKFSLYYMDIESNEYLRLGLDNDIDADWDKGVFTDNFRGVWITLGDCYTAPELIAEEDTYNLYSIPILLNGSKTNLRAIYDYDSESFEILGAYDGIDSETGMSSRNIAKLSDGDVITFLFDSVNADTGEEVTYQMGEITYDSSMIMTESDLFDGDYLYQYEVTDIFGNVYYSDSAIMECDNGDIYAYEIE